MEEPDIYYDEDQETWRQREHGGLSPTGSHVPACVAMEYIDSLLAKNATLTLKAARYDTLITGRYHYDPPTARQSMATILIDASALHPPRGDTPEALADALIAEKEG